MYTRQIFGTTLDAAGQQLVTSSKNEFFRETERRPVPQAAFVKEAKEEGKISQGRRCTMQSQLAPRHTD
jgi:hypothetical protein